MGKLGQAKSAKTVVTALMTVDAAGTPERLGGFYTNTTIAIVAGTPDTITDSDSGFLNKMFKAGMKIKISGTVADDGVYTIASVAAGTITLTTGGGFTGELAGSAITIECMDKIFCKGVLIQAFEANTGNVVTGDANIDLTTGQGAILTPLNSETYEGVCLDDLYLDAAVNDEGVSVKYEESL